MAARRNDQLRRSRQMFQQSRVDEKTRQETDYYWSVAERMQGRNRPRINIPEHELFAPTNTAGIDFDQYDAIEVHRSGPQADTIPVLHSFKELYGALPGFMQTNLDRVGYERPTPIQRHAIPVGLKGLDMMCCAQTGSGKTFAYLIPMVYGLTHYPVCPLGGEAVPHGVVMAPTRELASQIHWESLKLCFSSSLRPVVVYGGAPARQQLSELARGCDLVVATPGRLIDFVDRGVIILAEVHFLVLDEADRMLDMGFEPQIRQVVEQRDMPLKDERQTTMFSATFPPAIQQLAAAFLRPYVWITVGRVGSTVESITQRVIQSNGRDKLRLLLDLLRRSPPGRTLVFVKTKNTASWLKRQLPRELGVEEIHGDRNQAQREEALAAFRRGVCQVLVATNVAARGLDIPEVAHVINFDLPTAEEEFDEYVHRIGRTGRVGNTGVATAFYVPGFDNLVGNGKVGNLLLRLLLEAKQEVPEWFLALPEVHIPGGGAHHGGPSRDIRHKHADRSGFSSKTYTHKRGEEHHAHGGGFGAEHFGEHPRFRGGRGGGRGVGGGEFRGRGRGRSQDDNFNAHRGAEYGDRPPARHHAHEYEDQYGGGRGGAQPHHYQAGPSAPGGFRSNPPMRDEPYRAPPPPPPPPAAPPAPSRAPQADPYYHQQQPSYGGGYGGGDRAPPPLPPAPARREPNFYGGPASAPQSQPPQRPQYSAPAGQPYVPPSRGGAPPPPSRADFGGADMGDGVHKTSRDMGGGREGFRRAGRGDGGGRGGGYAGGGDGFRGGRGGGGGRAPW